MDISFIKKIKDRFHKKSKEDKSKQSSSLTQLEKLAIEELRNARANFNDADEDTIDLAIYELMVAEERLNLLIKNKKRSNS